MASQFYSKSFWRLFFSHVIAIFRPNHDVTLVRAHGLRPGSMDHWTDDERRLLIEQGRLQLSRQLDDIERVRQRAQFCLTTGLAILAGYSFVLTARVTNWASVTAVVFGLSSTLIGIVAAVGVLVGKKSVGLIDTALVSQVPSGLLRSLSVAYAEGVSVGENTVATAVALFRGTVLFLACGALIFGLAIVVSAPEGDAAPSVPLPSRSSTPCPPTYTAPAAVRALPGHQGEVPGTTPTQQGAGLRATTEKQEN